MIGLFLPYTLNVTTTGICKDIFGKLDNEEMKFRVCLTSFSLNFKETWVFIPLRDEL
jgi:hypothetical protein